MTNRYRENQSILIVDDNEANVLLLEDLLEDHGFTNVRSVTDPRKVLAETQKEMPDLMLLDIRMPGMSGFDVMQKLKETQGKSFPAIMVLTAQTDINTRSKALSMGALDFLNKPFDHQDIIFRIKQILSATEQKRFTENELTLFDEDIEALKTMSFTDEVTGLPNRRFMQKTIYEEFAKEIDLTAFYIELDGGESLAKTYGYEIADRAMRTIAETLTSSPIGQISTVGIWSNQQFLVLKIIESEEYEDQFAERIYQLLTGVHEIGTLHFTLSVRIGYACSKGLVKQPGELIRRAVLAVPEINSGYNHAQYNAKIDQENSHASKIEAELRQSMVNNELFLMFQPKVCLSEKVTVGAESLIRWRNKTLGDVPPDSFIHIAERLGMINQIGEWVFEQSVAQLKEWIASGKVGINFKMAINVSSIQLFNPTFIEFVKSTLNQQGISPSQIQIEITESMFISNVDIAIDVLNQFRALGITIAMDDFGTGFSSLSYLQNLPLDTLKIDRCFVDQMIDTEKSRRLVQAIIALAHTFDLEVVAEGIETDDQHRMLVNMGCEDGQGYLFNKPLLAEDFPIQPLTSNRSMSSSYA